MKVILAVPYTLNPHGGVETVAYNTVQGFKKIHSLLEKEGITLIIISTAKSSKIENLADYPNIKVIPYSLPPSATFTGFSHAYRNNKKVIRKSDIVHSHDIYNAYAGIKASKPTALTLHGIYWKEKLADRTTLKKLVYYSGNTLSFKHIFRGLTNFVAISPYVLDELKEARLNTDKVVIIENPISDVFFSVKKETDTTKDIDIIWYPAVISPRKNQLAMIETMKYLMKEYREPVTLVFTGGITDKGYFLALKAKTQKYKLSNNVRFLGKIPYKELLELYSKSTLAVLLSRQETAPMVISEALATGTPVVSSPAGGVPYMIDHGIDGFLVNPNNPQEVAEKIIRILEDRKLQKRMGTNGKKKAIKRWKAEIIAKKLIGLYLKVYEEG
ncbi:glycosyltransferase family 4 protein [Thermococcus camini]|uniref:Glycosyl transferase n=1 Tax=Thermococcus camini TaxID=2016373 RepID=A0A7G2D4B2_9EURY|nr:glycosyltransferase family 4 protein [Thermococcus camini]CAD5243337.1 Glycosyl transferase [Thermococcus camini]